MGMARLIDADALKERAIRVSTVKEHCYMKAVGTHEIDKAPTVDAVPVVRCKDCKHYGCERTNYIGRAQQFCNLHKGLVVVDRDSFCSYGERKDNV